MRRTLVSASAVLIVASMSTLLAACASPVSPDQPAPTATFADQRASAVDLLADALDAGSPGTTDEQRAASLNLAIETVKATCADPDTPVSGEAFDLLRGARSVLDRNGIDACVVFG